MADDNLKAEEASQVVANVAAKVEDDAAKVEDDAANGTGPGIIAADDAELTMMMQNEKMERNRAATRRSIDKKTLMSTYLYHRARIQRLTTAIQLGVSIRKIKQWKRERAASERKVRNIEQNNF